MSVAIVRGKWAVDLMLDPGPRRGFIVIAVQFEATRQDRARAFVADVVAEHIRAARSRWDALQA
jgi:hypothetical protein